MNGKKQENESKNIFRFVFKIVLCIMFSLALAIIAGAVILEDDLEKVTEKNKSYSAQVTENGDIQYVYENEDGTIETVKAEEMADDLRVILEEYIDGTEEEVNKKIEYFMGAEAVTKLPYISPEEKENAKSDTPEGESGETEDSTISLDGQIKFYRYTEGSQSTEENKIEEELKEENRLKYVNKKTFDEMIATYESGGDPDGELFKYFTLDKGNALIAYGSKEVRKITTGGEKGIADSSLTLDIVNQNSSVTYSQDNTNDGFIMVKYTAEINTIDYLSLVEQYVMPSNLLYSFLIETKDVAFVEALANLAYESEIAIGIYDNNSESITNEDYLYKKKIELNAMTTISLDNIKTSEPDMPNVDKNTISTQVQENKKNKWIPVQHYASVDEAGQLNHYVAQYFGRGAGNAERIATEDVFYVENLTSDNKATNLVASENANQLYVNYYQQINAKATPTIGVILADTWVAKWTVSYLKEDQEPTGTSNSGKLDDKITKEYKINTENAILNEFTSTYKETIQGRLNEKYENMKKYAKDTIVEITDFTVEPENYTRSDAWRDGNHIKRNLENWITGCGTCKAIVSDWFEVYKNGELDPNQEILPKGGEWDSAFNAIYNNKLGNSHVKAHINQKLQSYINRKNEQNRLEAEEEARKRKERFIEEIDKQIYLKNQSIYGKKSDVEITYTSSFSRTSVTHKRDETIEMEEAGKKFSEVFNNNDYYLAKEGIMTRTDWLWEYIRKNDDTAKLENAVRYLLNRATKSEKFGIFTQDEIDNLLSTFLPQEVQVRTSIGYLSTFAEWLKSYENEPLRKYVNGDESLAGKVEKYVVKDADGKLYGKMYFTPNDGCWNYTYGIMVRTKSGKANNTAYFEKYGLNLESLIAEALAGGEARVPIETLDSIYMDLITDKKDALVKEIEEEKVDPGNPDGETIKMEIWQYYALTSVCYQWGNCGQYLTGSDNIAKIYKTYYIDQANPQAFRDNAVCKTSKGGLAHFFNAEYVTRQNATWMLFNEGKFLLQDGTELFASGAGNVVEFALQFKGCTAPEVRTEGDPTGGLFAYNSTDGKAFWADEWCAMFVSYCYDKCGLIEAIDGTYFSCTTKLNEIKNTDKFRGPEYIPNPGDVILYTKNGGKTSNHTGIVVSCNGTKLVTVEGNMSNSNDYSSTVKVTNYHTVGASNIAGYIVPSDE